MEVLVLAQISWVKILLAVLCWVTTLYAENGVGALKRLDEKYLDRKGLDEKYLDRKGLDEKGLDEKGPDEKGLDEICLE
jgi:hypothetical protein